MNKLNKTRVLTWIIAAAPLILVAVMYDRLPDKVPTQWGVDGSVRYGGKATLWWLAGLSPAMAALFMLLPKIDPRGQNYSKFKGAYDGFCLIMMIFLLGMLSLVISESLNPGKIQVSAVVTAACGLLFMFLGRMTPKIQSNFFMGFRTPWTLSNSGVWRKTHKLAGILFFYGGLLIVVLAFLLSGAYLMKSMLAVVAAICLVPYVMSYVWYKKLPPA